MNNIRYMFVFILLSVSFKLVAADNVIFRGTLNESPVCTVNDNKVLSVDFGNDLLTTKIDGTNYVQRVPYTFDCKVSNIWVWLRIDGTTFVNTDALKTSNNDLGLTFRANGSLLRIGQSVTFFSSNPPVITVAPVKRSGASLKGGAFSAGASLLMQFD